MADSISGTPSSSTDCRVTDLCTTSVPPRVYNWEKGKRNLLQIETWQSAARG